MPKRLRSEAKGKLHEIWMADTREHAHRAFDLFLATYEAKYPKARACRAIVHASADSLKGLVG